MIKKYFPFALYTLVLCLLSIGVIFYSNSIRGIKVFLFYVISLLIWCVLFGRIFRKKISIDLFSQRLVLGRKTPSISSYASAILVSFLLYLVFYFIHLGYVPILRAILSSDYYEIVKIRQFIPDRSGAFYNYANSLLLRSFLPTVLVVSYLKRNRIFIPMFVCSCVFALALIQKSYIALLLTPLMVVMGFKRKWIEFSMVGFFTVVSVYFLMVVTNQGVSEVAVERSDQVSIVGSLSDRIFIIPGRVVAQWSDIIPEKLPFSKGCSYRVVAHILGCQFQNTATEIYKILNPSLLKMGVEGSVNAASFMQDYANFGYYGLAFSSLVLCLILFFITVLFRDNILIGLSLNTVPILLLSSVSLSLTLVSGGWLLTLAIYVLFQNDFKWQRD